MISKYQNIMGTFVAKENTKYGGYSLWRHQLKESKQTTQLTYYLLFMVVSIQVFWIGSGLTMAVIIDKLFIKSIKLSSINKGISLVKSANISPRNLINPI